jgi:hypothetical protein
MKKFFIYFGALVIAGVAIWNMSLSTGNSFASVNLSLSKVEALSGCEVSSTASLNKGYCSKKYGSSGDACVTTGNGSETRCSGNTN